MKDRRNTYTPWGFANRTVVWTILGAAFVFYATPIVWLLFAAFRTESELFSSGAFHIGSFASLRATWNNLATYQDFLIGQWAVNSIIYSVGGVGLSLIAAIPAGYVLAIYDFRFRKTILVLTLVAMITPNTVVALPIYLQMQALGLTNSYLGMILATAFFPFGVYLSFIFYVTSLPRSLVESARIDGATRFEVFVKIALPLSGPLLALVAFFSFLSNWSNYFLAFVLLTRDELYSLPIGLAVLISSSGALGNDVASDIPINRPEAIVAALLVILPVLLIFLVSQRYVRAGLLSGAEKG